MRLGSTIVWWVAAFGAAGCATTSAQAPSVAPAPTTMAPPAPVEAAPAKWWGGGYGDYRFGMTRAEVKGVKSCQPYQDFFSNPDFECPNLDVDGRTRNVSFHFDADGRLTKVQLWFVEAAPLAEAVQGFLDVNEHFRIHFGSSAPPNASELATNMLRVLPPHPARIVVRPGGNTPKDAEVWCEVWRFPQIGYAVMLYYGYPPTAPAAVKASDSR